MIQSLGKETMRGILLLAALAASAFGQDSGAGLRFEVASVKGMPPQPIDRPLPGPPFTGGPGTSDPERLTIRSSLRLLVSRAYGVEAFRVFGPASMDAARYEIIANVPPGATAEQVNVMLQNLLEDRLELKVHHETRTLQVYILTVDKKGFKLKPSDNKDDKPTAPVTRVVPDSEGFLPVPAGMGVVALPRDGHMRVSGSHAAIAQMVPFLQLDHPLLDQTGLTGKYDFHLDFASTRAPVDSDPAPGIFSALRDQMGLSLREEKVPMDVVVIDRADSEPVPNQAPGACTISECALIGS
jgi:uncharacterized protein (TIGR03435 family)